MGTGEDRFSRNCTQRVIYQRNIGLSRGIRLERLEWLPNLPNWLTLGVGLRHECA